MIFLALVLAAVVTAGTGALWGWWLRDQSDAGRDDLLAEVVASGVEFDHPGLRYVVVQIDRCTWDELSAFGGQRVNR